MLLPPVIIAHDGVGSVTRALTAWTELVGIEVIGILVMGLEVGLRVLTSLRVHLLSAQNLSA